MPEPPQPGQLPVSPEDARDFFKEFHDRYRYYIDQNGALTEKAFEVNKQIISLYERLLLIAVGTIGLSITAFVTLAGRFTPHVSRHAFVWLICVAWGLLFISATSFNSAITHTIIENASLFKHWANLLETYHSQMFATSLTKLSSVLGGKVPVGGENHDIRELFAKLANDLNEAGASVEKERMKMLQVGSVRSSPVRKLAGVGIIAMQLGFVLLCVAAIKAFLAV